MSIARTVAGVEGAILIDANGAVVLSTDGGGGGSTSVWSATDATANGMTLTNGGLTVTPSGAASWQSIRSSVSKTSSQLYVEFKTSVAVTSADIAFGLANAGFVPGASLGDARYGNSAGIYPSENDITTGFISHYVTSMSIAANDVWALAVDFAAGNVWIGQNNVWANASSPATASLPILSFVPATVGALFAAMTFNGASVGVWTLQSQPSQQKYLPPPGFQAWDGGPVTPSTSVWSASDAAANSMTLTNGGLTVTAGTNVWGAVRGTVSRSSGKLYFEVSNSVTAAGNNVGIALGNAGFNIANYPGATASSMGAFFNTYILGNGFTINIPALPSTPPVAGDVLAMAVDFGTGNVWLAYNNIWQSSGNPATGANPAATFVLGSTGPLFPTFAFETINTGVWTLHPTDASLTYRPPPGFQAWDGGPVTPSTSQWSAADAAANAMTLSNGGLTFAMTTTPYQSIRGTISRSSGKYYVEFLNVVAPNGANNFAMGLADAGFVATNYLGSTPNSLGIYGGGTQETSGFTVNFTLPSTIPVANDVLALAVDFTAGKIWIALNNSWFDSGNPGAGTGEFGDIAAPAFGLAYFPALTGENAVGKWTLQATAASQKYLPPPGFQAWDGGPITPVTSVWSASDAAANAMTLSNGGLTVAANTGGWASIRNTVSHTSGKAYIEFLGNVVSGATDLFGLANAGFVSNTYLGAANYSVGLYNSGNQASGFTMNYAIPQVPAINDVWALAVDFTAGRVWIAQNNVWLGGSNPATGSLPVASFTPATVGALFAGMSFIGGPYTWTLQATAASQKYAPPAGFSAWDSAAPVVTAHRYWRLNITAVQTTGYAALAEVQFRTSAGVPLLFSGGTASASSIDTPGFDDPPDAADNNPATFWASFGQVPQWWGYDYGAGNAKAVVEITILPRADLASQGPTIFTPQWSDDGTSWTPMATITGVAPWTAGVIQTFPVQKPSAAYLARTVGGNEGGNGANIATLIDGLVADGVWAKLDALYVLAQQNATDARLNLVSASYPLTGSATFTAYKGFSAFPVGGLSTGFNPSSSPSPQFTLNSASIAAWSYDDPGIDYASIGTDLGAVGTSVVIASYAANSYAEINAADGSVLAPSLGIGYIAGDRASATAVNLYHTGVSVASGSVPTTGLFSGAIVVGSAATSFNTTSTISAAHIGASLGSAGQLALYTRLRTYMTAVGVP